MPTCSTAIRVNETRVIRQRVDKERLVATLFRPIASGPRPTVIVLSGSLGGMMEGSAAVLSSQGFAALAIAYFGVDPLPPELVEVPLEYFAEGIAWLKEQPAVDPDRIAVMGVSKGGELAVLLGATYPEDIKAVVGYSASPVVWRGASYRPLSFVFGKPKSSWTLGGEPVPFVDVRPRFSEAMGAFIGKLPSLRTMHERGRGRRLRREHPGRKDQRSGAVDLAHRRPGVARDAPRGDGDRAPEGSQPPLPLPASVLRGRRPSDQLTLFDAGRTEMGSLVSGR